jgi:nitrogen-specific signal transduction histidine kinase
MKRIVPAALLLLAVVAGLLWAWWVSSRRALDAELGLQQQTMRRIVFENERVVADRLSLRLEELRARESERAYFHYQNLFHDPKGASQGLSVSPSPLAAGPIDPLVQAHFQIDTKGRVTLPTLNEDLDELSAPNASLQVSIRDDLSDAAHALRGAVQPVIAELERQAQERRAMTSRIAELESEKQKRVDVVDAGVFAQNQQANVVYQQLKQQAPQRAIVSPRAAPPVEIRTSELQWSTVPIGGVPALIALRAVHTPDGTLVQGILTRVANGAVLDGAVVRRGLMQGTPIEGTGWRVVMPGPPLVSRDAQRERFTWTFWAVASGLMLIVAVVIWTLWKTERLASDRARFAATAAHELRTPLASLRVYSDLIAEERDPGKRERYAREIAGQTDRLGRVVANVLEVTRLERGTFALEAQPGEIGRAVAECVARLEPHMEAAQCPIELRVAPDLPAVAFDPDALHHVVDNLVDNAEKFSRDASDRSIRVEVIREGEGVAIVVSDRGPGVPEELLREARPFRRGASPIAPSGLGLGLFLVDRIAKGHGGTLRSTRREGGGAAVHVYLPAFYKP